MKKIKLITFDLDDTLWPVQPVIARADIRLEQWLAEHAPYLGPMSPARIRELRQQLVNQNPCLKDRISELRYQTLFKACIEAGDMPARAHDIAESAFQVFLAERQQVELFEEAILVLEQLSQRYVLGALSNGNADIRRVGLFPYFSFALNADMAGVAKPDVRIFNAALALANCDACQAVHVGDHPVDDVQGAQNAGMQAVWLNRDGRDWGLPQRSNAEITRLDQLLTVLNELESSTNA